MNVNELHPAQKLNVSHHAVSERFHHYHVVLLARISLTLSRHFSLSFITSGRSSGLHPVSSHSCWMYVCAGRPAFARPCHIYLTIHYCLFVWLVGFVGYLTPNPFLCKLSVLFKTIQFSMSTPFNSQKHFHSNYSVYSNSYEVHTISFQTSYRHLKLL